MNAFTFVHKFLAILILAVCCFLTSPIKAQTIQIDSLFTSDGEIFPFEPSDTIYGLSISGSITLSSDTSLVRVILTDNSGTEWMVYEAYPMIVEEQAFNIFEECDETCFLNEFVPNSIKIQIIDAVLLVNSLNYSGEVYGETESLQFQSKRNKDIQKLENINHNIFSRGWNWVAGDNELLAKYYSIKARLFGFPKYNLQGYDYYISGDFKYISGRGFIKNSGSLRNEFDWRAKHDANVENTPYFSPYGWITDLRNQHSCGSCWVFSSVASVEAVANLYFNQHCDYDLSEQDVLCCSPGIGNCDIGYTYNALNYLKNPGTFNEQNYIYDTINYYYNGCCGQDQGNPAYILKCKSKSEVPLSIKSIDTIKTRLITTGPLVTWINSSALRLNHAMSLIGYYTDEATDEIQFVFKNSYNNISTMPLSWEDIEDMYTVNYPITITIAQPPVVLHRDEDKDGYYNWGIGGIPSGWEPPCNPKLSDWNDNNNRIGPCDVNYYGTPVKPDMLVTVGSLNPSPVTNHGFYFFNTNNFTLNFQINNPGNAQLNLTSIPVSKSEPVGQNCFTLLGQPVVKEICMNGEPSAFDVRFSTQNPNGVYMATITIYVNEPDIPTYQFAVVYNGCQTMTGTTEINGIVNWNDPFKLVQNDIKITPRSILTITGNVAFTQESDIFVDPGGKLVIDGGKLTGSCKSLWNGIDIWGSSSMPQSTDYQGMVELKNGGMIEFADTAIATVRNYGLNKIPTGGIINCKDAIFKDNYVGVCLPAYVSPIGKPNVSYFKRTQFKITDDYYIPGNLLRTAPKCGFQLAAQIGVYLEGCSFTNESSAEKRRRGCGIINMDAGCYVKSACLMDNQLPCVEFVPSRFEGLDYGIKTSNIYSSRTFSVESADFIDNYRGIYMSLTNDATIIKNHFELNANDYFFQPGDTLVGIYSERCNRYKIEENVVNGYDPDQFDLVGMHILNSGPRGNEIYNNSLNHLLSGIIAAGENCDELGTGLCIKCNDFTSCDFDIYVTSQGGNISKYFGIAISQGKAAPPGDPQNPTYAASNTFSVESGSNPNYTNAANCKPLIYTHHGNNTSGKKIIPYPREGQITLNPDGGVDYSEKAAACPSHLSGGINISSEKNNLIGETLSLLNIEDTLAALVDGGETEELSFDIQNSFPDEALLLRQELIDKSPYLSDTVMKSAINKDDVLPNAMIRDILTANPQSAKSGDILEAVENRIDPMPDYMLTEILQGQNVYGAKEILEQDLADHKTLRDKSLSKIIKYYKTDTNNIQVSVDSLINLMQSENEPSTDYELSFLFLVRSDSINTFGILANIPSEFDLSQGELITQSQYTTLFNLLWEIQADTTGLDSRQIENLFNLYQLNNSIPGIYSRNILLNENLIHYEETVFLPEITLKSLIAPNSEVPKAIINSMLKVFPNPSGNYFIVEYNLEKLTSPAIIKLSDMNGQTLNSWQLNDNRNQFIISTEEYGSGIYNLRLFVGNNLKEAVKLIIKR